MAKLHELLAVESDLRSQAETTRADLKKTFEGKGHHFTKRIVTFKSNEEGKADKVEGQLSLQTMVTRELDWISQKLAKAMDTGHQIDMANVTAVADLILDDGSVLLTGVPATSLLRMEHRVTEVRDLVHSIPTLDPAKGFLPDADEGAGVYRARDDERPRTEKKFDFVVMVGPTDKHPAQVKELMLDKSVGVVVTQEWSSLITVSAKGDMLDRVEELLRSIKKARARANELDIDPRTNKIGAALLGYVFSGAKI